MVERSQRVIVDLLKGLTKVDPLIKSNDLKGNSMKGNTYRKASKYYTKAERKGKDKRKTRNFSKALIKE